MLAPVEAPDAGAEALRRAVASYADASSGWARGRGCLLCNTAVERGALAPASGRFVAAYLDRLTRAFRALGNARRSGDLDPVTDLDALAAFFSMALIGVAASIRAEAPAEQVRAACAIATSVLDRHLTRCARDATVMRRRDRWMGRRARWCYAPDVHVKGLVRRRPRSGRRGPTRPMAVGR